MENRLGFRDPCRDSSGLELFDTDDGSAPNVIHNHRIPPLNSQRCSGYSAQGVPPKHLTTISHKETHNSGHHSTGGGQRKELRLLVMAVGLLLIVGAGPALAVGQEQEADRRMMRPVWMQPKHVSSDERPQKPGQHRER